MKKQVGVLLPVFSLPGKEGIGGFGKEAYHFIDDLSECGFKIWQVLPLNALNKDYSPYSSISSYAGETMYISLARLVEYGFLDEYEEVENTGHVNYDEVSAYKEKYLEKAYAAFDENNKYYPEFLQYKANYKWLDSYSTFAALYHQNDKKNWNEWTIQEADEKLKDFEAFKQYLFYRQWFELKLYAKEHEITIMGDLPFYIGYNSQDVWEHQDYFLLDPTTLKPTHVSGVPPDYFNEDGQRWDHPIYDWDKMEANKFDYWTEKIIQATEIYDLLRLDHFRAFDTFWKIDVNGRGARVGEWIEAPGDAFFKQLFDFYPDIQLVAEDLGELRKEVLELKDKYKLDGMRCFQFSINDLEQNKQPHNIVFYTGTHDNDTIMGWYTGLADNEKRRVLKLLKMSALPINLKIIKYVFDFNCPRAVVPMQDLLGLGNEARINAPGTMGGFNWSYRFIDFDAFEKVMPDVKEMIESIPEYTAQN